jgi:hypothetical protein
MWTRLTGGAATAWAAAVLRGVGVFERIWRGQAASFDLSAHAGQTLGAIEPALALHVGDLEELDVEGARRAGMYSALYSPTDDEVQTDAHVVVRDWRDFDQQVAGLMCSAKRL